MSLAVSGTPAANDSVSYLLAPLIQAYLRDCRRQGRSVHTLAGYGTVLQRGLPADWGTLQDVTRDAVRAWMDGGVALARGTVKWRWAVLRAFLNWLDAEEYPVDARALRLKGPRLAVVEPETLGPAELQALLRAVWHPYPRRPTLGRHNRATVRRLTRNHLILRVLYCTGVRVSELCALTPADLVEGMEAYLTVRHGKGDKPRIVPLPEDGGLLRDLQRYLSEFPIAAEARLFRLSRKGVEDMLLVTAHRAGITRRVHPHLFRHTFATDYLAQGGDPLKLRRVLGHTTLQMVNRYVHFAKGTILQGWAMKDPGRER